MTSKEKYLNKIAGRESVAVTEARERIKNREWLHESQQLALRILVRLDQLGMKQKDLAEKLEVSAQYVNKLLKGKEKFGWDNVIAIQRILNMPILVGYQPTMVVMSKSYTEQGEVNNLADLETPCDEAKKIKLGRVIPLFEIEKEYETLRISK